MRTQNTPLFCPSEVMASSEMETHDFANCTSSCWNQFVPLGIFKHTKGVKEKERSRKTNAAVEGEQERVVSYSQGCKWASERFGPAAQMSRRKMHLAPAFSYGRGPVLQKDGAIVDDPHGSRQSCSWATLLPFQTYNKHPKVWERCRNLFIQVFTKECVMSTWALLQLRLGHLVFKSSFESACEELPTFHPCNI
jgi:hypothetical protein